jgi:Carboxypeptidase regulatory-like domain
MRSWLAVFLLCLAAVCAPAQSITGLSGVVTDPSGAIIPKASVEVSNVETGAQRSTTADDQGRYTFPQMPPGTYRITANASGFTSATVDQVHLLVNTPAVINLHLEVGRSTQTISVASGDTAQVSTQDATLGNAIGTRPIIQLPFLARNVVNLLSLQPGVTSGGNVNGGKSDQGNVTLDGVDVNDQQYRSAFTSVLRNTLDSIQEFRTTTTNGNADAGRTSGAQVALITKSGTNELHGALYEYHRNTLTSANDFFNNLAGISRQKLIQNTFGAALGGPIRKNRLFYFLNFEGRRDASEATALRVVPNALFRQGIFTYQNSAGNLLQLTSAEIKGLDPTAQGVNPNVLKVLQAYPEPNDKTVGDGLNTAGYRFKSAVPLSYNT